MKKLALILTFSFNACSLFSQSSSPLFTILQPKNTKVDFINHIDESEGMNVLAYEYFYNGGGVAAGDLNNDGLIDLFFTGNLSANKLYLNKGNFVFSDITRKAGLTGRKHWKTGVTMVDVNADGWLDIYVCYSGRGNEASRRNELYINNKDLTFSEQASRYGLDDPGCTTQAIFFDYDIDGDLDCYVLNHNIKAFKHVELKYLKSEYDSLAADRLYRNDNGKFVDVSSSAGIIGNPISFGLGVAVSDINNDGWPDIYVSNDYTEQDYCYINNKNGTFSQKEFYMFTHMSQFSMGSDIADINNDGLVDIYTLDMLPEDNRRQKLLQSQENYELHQKMITNGFHYQFMRNMLQLNNGNGTFSEIGQIAGISNTDWSWAALFADLDNDGNKDLFVTNGYMRDYTNKDFMKYWGDYLVKQVANRDSIRYMDIISKMPSTVTSNYVFRNNGDLTFTDATQSWGVKKPGLSNGCAYADLDNDGDLDIIINNISEPATILRNESDGKQNYLDIKLVGEDKNLNGLGAKVYCFTQDRMQLLEQMPTRGYQSSVTNILHYGTGKSSVVDSVKVVWLDGTQQVLYNQAVNTTLTLHQKNAKPATWQPKQQNKLFHFVAPVVQYSHVQMEFNDFKVQPLMPSMLSQCGPQFVVFDANGDGNDDIYFGSSEGQPSALFLQKRNSFEKHEVPAFAEDTFSTTGEVIAFDADGDKDLDIYASGGGYNLYRKNDPRLNDRLFLNDGLGNYALSQQALPAMTVSKSAVTAADIDNDGDNDLFVGGRCIPGEYPMTPLSFLLINDGKGKFTDRITEWAPGLQQAGMITAAAWNDLNGDGRADLIILTEWGHPRTFLNNGNSLNETDMGLSRFNALWQSMLLSDMDNDGDDDLVAGNWGLNSQFHCSNAEPIEMFYSDFDKNGSIDPILTCFIRGRSYPYISRDELLDQIYPMRKKFTSYLSFADATIADVFTTDELAKASRLAVTHLQTMYFENRSGSFFQKQLPIQAQFAPITRILANDVDGDGDSDLLLFGNNEYVRLKLGKLAGNFGTVLLNDGKGNFEFLPNVESGLFVGGDVKDAAVFTMPGMQMLLIGVNNSDIINFKIR